MAHDQGDLAILDKSIRVKGELSFAGTLRVSGQIDGKIQGGRELIIEKNGLVRGAVEADTVYVYGLIEAEYVKAGKIEIHPGGRILGDIETKSLIIEEGGVLEGKCNMKLNTGQGPQVKVIEQKERTSSKGTP